MQVADILKSKGARVVTARPETPIGDILRTMWLERIGASNVSVLDGGTPAWAAATTSAPGPPRLGASGQTSTPASAPSAAAVESASAWRS